MRGDVQVAQYLLPADMQRVQNRDDLRLWNFQGYVIASSDDKRSTVTTVITSEHMHACLCPLWC